MSDTRDALAEAIRVHVAAEADGAYLTDWVLIAAAAVPSDADATSYLTECSDGPIHNRIGLARYLTLKYDEQLMADDDE